MIGAVRNLKPDAKQQVLWLHQEAFSGIVESPCVPCKGGCCRGCASAEGYLSYSLSKEDLAEVKKKYGFTKTKGFLTPTGCALPIEERSAICVGFVCAGYVVEGGWGRGVTTFPTKETEVPFTLPSIAFSNMIREIMWNKDNYEL